VDENLRKQLDQDLYDAQAEFTDLIQQCFDNGVKGNFTPDAIFRGVYPLSTSYFETYFTKTYQSLQNEADDDQLLIAAETADSYAHKMIIIIMETVTNRCLKIGIGQSVITALENELLDIRHHIMNSHILGLPDTERRHRGKRQQTTIVNAVRENRTALEMAAYTLLTSIDARIKEIRDSGSNIGAFEEIPQLMDLRKAILRFLKVLDENVSGKQIEIETFSLKGAAIRWLDKNNDTIFTTTFKTIIATTLAGVFSVLGAHGDVAVLTAGTAALGKDLVDVIHGAATFLIGKKDDEHPPS